MLESYLVTVGSKIGELMLLMNEIYTAYWNPPSKFFMPMMKLKAKTRIGGKIVKQYDTPKTPYQRLIDSRKLDRTQKMRLSSQKEGKIHSLLKETTWK